MGRLLLNGGDAQLIFSFFIVIYRIMWTAFCFPPLVWRTPRAETSRSSIILRSASVINLLIACSVFGYNSILSLVCKTALSSGGGSGSSKFNPPAHSITLSDRTSPYFPDQLSKPHVACCSGHIRNTIVNSWMLQWEFRKQSLWHPCTSNFHSR